MGADWLAFIDDDETAAPDWVAKLMAPEYRGVPVLLGGIAAVYPDPMPFWVTHKRLAGSLKGKEGARRKTGVTGNVRLSAALWRAGLRFDETLGLMGGEDNEFFSRAHAMGFEIRRTLRAVVTETAHPERLTFSGLMYRAYWCGASDMRRLAITKGWPGAILRKAHTVPINLAIGVLELAASRCARFGAPTPLSAARCLAARKLPGHAEGLRPWWAACPNPTRRSAGIDQSCAVH